MNKLYVALAALVLVLAVSAGVRTCASLQGKIHSAEAAVRALQQRSDSLQAVASRASAQAGHTDTVRIAVIKRIAVVDSLTKPDSTCIPAIAIRDTVIAIAGAEIQEYRSAYEFQLEATSVLAAQRDTLQGVIRSLHPTFLSIPVVGKNVSVGLVAILAPRPAVGIGVSFNLFGFKL